MAEKPKLNGGYHFGLRFVICGPKGSPPNQCGLGKFICSTACISGCLYGLRLDRRSSVAHVKTHVALPYNSPRVGEGRTNSRVGSRHRYEHRTISGQMCPLGLPSFVALSLGAKLVHITDGELESVRLCEKSAAALPPSLQQCCQVSQLVWGSQLNLEDHSDYDIIMGSDVIYWESSIRPFCETVQSLLRRFPRAVFYLAYMNRATTVDKRLQDEFRQSGIQTTKIDCDTFWEAPGQIWMLTLHPAVKEQPQMVVI
eukprot:Protomagalhaensia_wolfi_Nauph_80__2385@NODE_256_length_3046_cov_26_802793_g191_i0_p2_GENE_NODE_256_length_3046_cov_26_802793_g191_i0NODE_256_length_3046_cov_26_802793_g191_i0_p2_ORF_typecomplete_len256_score14_10Methyltransf_16/PF10294_9/6_2e18Methyltransf_23/PF13489_6/0_045_NODE_256_length_3046_cov_26_802793_g191_i0130897